jgi:methionine-rich copper-binding protein CopC
MKYFWMLLLLVPLVCMGHSKVVATVPAQGAQLETSPDVVTIQFNKAIEPHFHKAELSVKGTWQPLVSKVDAQTLTIMLKANHQTDYQIRWSVISQDGHRQRGTLTFRVGKSQ